MEHHSIVAELQLQWRVKCDKIHIEATSAQGRFAPWVSADNSSFVAPLPRRA